jgi:inosine/xanthosine triphosphatase
MRIALGSENPIKIQAVKNVFSKIYPNLKLHIFSVKIVSNVPDQPFNQDTIKGAINRAKEVMAITETDLAIGIEAGLLEFPLTLSGYFDMQWCAIIDKNMKITLGCSSGFELPLKIVHQAVTDGKEVGKLMDEMTSINDVGRKMGAIGILSKGIMNRIHLNEQAVLMAMIPRINEKEYFNTGEEE